MNSLPQKALLVGLALLLSACAGVQRRGAPRVYAQGFDTETNACLRFPGNCPGAQGMAAQQKVAETGATLGSIGATLYAEDKAQQNRIAEAILDCVKDADFTPDGHPFEGLSQGQVYKTAFGVNPARVASRWDIQRSLPK
jgi:hypothetical protein